MTHSIMGTLMVALTLFLLFGGVAQAHPPLQVETIQIWPEDPISPLPSLASDIVVDPLYQLNGTWIPSHYNVELTIILDSGDESIVGDPLTAPGTVDIDFTVTDPVDHIILHANLLNNYNMTFNLTNKDTGAPIEIIDESPGLVPDQHFMKLQIAPEETLTQGVVYTLHAKSIATIFTDRTNALYASNYTDAEGNTKLIAATQMESYHLRQLFPSFDEPGLKANFSVTLNHRDHYKAIANGEMQSSVEIPEGPNFNAGWLKTTFSTTVEMSTYLFAITIADFDSALADSSLFDKPVRTWGDPQLIARGGGKYTADLTAKLLKFFDTFFNTTYPMPKMDSAAITHKGGAMENWGLILYRTDLLIYLAGETLETAKNSIASVVSHEVAHQNFGDLVTCRWWSDIWLNEGFATYVSYLGVDEVAPEFRHGEWQINDAIQPALAYDSGPNSHPIRNDAITPAEIDRYFDTITYDKGASINRMMEGFLTKTTFQKGLIYYLKAMEFQGAVQDNLFENLQKAVDEDAVVLPSDVKTILDTWTIQKSHPLVRVSAAGESQVFITQERYADPGPANLWYVPITVVTEDKPDLDSYVPQLWLTDNQTITTLSHNTSKWIMVNKDAMGFYRVLYDSELTYLIRSQLMKDAFVISPLSRSQLLDDYFNLAFKGFVNIETALEMTTYLEQEDHFTVWEVVFNQLRNSLKFIDGPTSLHIFSKYLIPKLEAPLNSLGIAQNETLNGAQEIFRMKLIDWACSLGHEDCIMHAHQLHAEWEKDITKNPIHVDIQATMTCSIVATGDQGGFDFIFKRYTEANIMRESALKTRYLNALACSSDETILQSLLNLTLQSDTTELDPTHRILLIQRVAMNSLGRQLVIDFLNTNWDKIVNQIGSDNVRIVLNIFSTLSSQLSTQEQLDNVLQLLASKADLLDKLNDNDKATLNSYVNTIRSNVNWMKTWGRNIISWMEKNPHPAKEQESSALANSPTTFIVMILVVVGAAFFH